jgi:3'-phosphoadenosine 5'-phosphosulfate sulfotransferase (PAPS reductase)/FAD synthetase
MEKILHVVSVSSGKDSVATLLLAREKHPLESIRYVFADTGNEDQIVYDYLDYLEQKLNIVIERLKMDFSERIINKRMFIARDQRKGYRNGKKIRWSNKAKRQALKVLHPTGIPFLDLCLWKGRFPSRRAQFCTEFLKTIPLIRYQQELVDDGYTVISWQGIRRDESESRKYALQIEYVDDYMWQYRPIADWTAKDTFDMQLKHGIEPNPLYKKGMSRVGCMACINANKNEIKEIADRFPEHIEKINHWENLVAACCKRGKASFFPNRTKVSFMDVPNINAKVAWARTTRGGRQFDIFASSELSIQAFSSAYGLCE